MEECKIKLILKYINILCFLVLFIGVFVGCASIQYQDNTYNTDSLNAIADNTVVLEEKLETALKSFKKIREIYDDNYSDIIYISENVDVIFAEIITVTDMGIMIIDDAENTESADNDVLLEKLKTALKSFKEIKYIYDIHYNSLNAMSKLTRTTFSKILTTADMAIMAIEGN